MQRVPFIVDAIIALDNQDGIGYKGKLPWPRVAEDMKHFRTVTTGRTCLCGWNTYKDVRTIPHLWQRELYPVRSEHTNSFILREMMARNRVFRPIVIGGAKTYTRFWNHIDQFFVTYIDSQYPVDTIFSSKLIQNGFPYVDQVRVFDERLESNTPRITIQRYARLDPKQHHDLHTLPEHFYLDI